MIKDSLIISGNRAIIDSYAKINLTLDVLGRRNDGYHEVDMIMQSVSLSDRIFVTKAKNEISIASNMPFLPTNEKNIAYRAVTAFCEHTGISCGAKIYIQKNIPVAAGLAGGSGNAAAVLAAMDALCNTYLSDTELCKIGAQLGADVPYCIMGGGKRAEGIGEALSDVPSLPDCHILLVKPREGVSTKLIYDTIDSEHNLAHPDTDLMINALSEGNLRKISETLCNIMERVTQKINPQIAGIKQKMLMNGALGALMSGSGPTVFGIFDDFKKAKASQDSFARQFKDVFLVRSI